MAKEMKFDSEARSDMMIGVEKLAKAVAVTLGPKGRNVIIEKTYGSPTITKDGVSVAREIELEDRFENMGAQMVKEVATKTCDIAGDGTTTATILAEAIYREGIKNVQAGANPMSIKRGIDLAAKEIVKRLITMSKAVDTNEEIAQVGTISANGDNEVGKLIAEAMKEVGTTGPITVEESRSMDTELEVKKGMMFERGYLSPYFVTDTATMEVEFDNPYILLVEQKIANLQEILPLLEQIMQTKRPLLIIAEDVEGEALATLVVNRMRGIIPVCAIKSPGFGDRRKDMMEDIAILTAGNFISEEVGIKLDSLTLDDLGEAGKVTISKNETVIIDGAGSSQDVEDRCGVITKQIENAQSPFEADRLKERLGKLTGGVAIIKVGAPTETAMKEKKDRVDDALHATRAAVEEGIVVGGGVALLKAAKTLENLVTSETDERIGVSIIQKACEAPITKLIENGGESSALIVEKLRNDDSDLGYNVANSEYVNMIQTGIVDPTKVTRSALQNAASIAGLLLTTECMISQIPEDNPQAAVPQMPMM